MAGHRAWRPHCHRRVAVRHRPVDARAICRRRGGGKRHALEFRWGRQTDGAYLLLPHRVDGTELLILAPEGPRYRDPLHSAPRSDCPWYTRHLQRSDVCTRRWPARFRTVQPGSHPRRKNRHLCGHDDGQDRAGSGPGRVGVSHIRRDPLQRRRPPPPRPGLRQPVQRIHPGFTTVAVRRHTRREHRAGTGLHSL